MLCNVVGHFTLILKLTVNIFSLASFSPLKEPHDTVSEYPYGCIDV